MIGSMIRVPGPRAWLPAAVAAAAILAWWLLAVHWAFDGRATALYMIGEQTPMPGWLKARENLYRWPGGGYDGQYFHLLAHGPFALRESAALMDRPRMRCQRILVPLLAWLLAGGRFEWVDPSYYALLALSLAAGVWCTARLAERRGASPWWGLAFLALPASLGSIQRMLVDGPLLAAAAGFVWLMETGRWRAAWWLAAAAPFVRESGLLLAAAASLVWAFRRSWKRAALWAASAVPFLLWLFSIRDLPGGAGFSWSGPFASILQLALLGEPSTPYPRLRPWLHALDLAALAGFLFASGVCLLRLRNLRLQPLSASVWASAAGAWFAGAALLTCHLEPRHAWDSVFSMGRIFAPVYMAHLLDAIGTGRSAVAVLCLAPAALRAALPLGPVALRVFEAFAKP